MTIRLADIPALSGFASLKKLLCRIENGTLEWALLFADYLNGQ
jgi:hypothetical protein